MGLGRVLLVGRAVADVAVEDDERWPTVRLAKNVQGVLDAIDVVGVADAQDVPAVAQKSAATSSVKVIVVLPSMVMWLLS